MPASAIGGSLAQTLHPPPPLPPAVAKTLRRSGPHLVPTWRRRRRIFFISTSGGYNFVFTPCLYTQNAQDLMENPNLYAKRKMFLTPDPPHPAPPNPAAGTGSPRGSILFLKHSTSVFKMIRGSF